MFFGYLSPIALPSEKHVAHTESVAPAKAQLPEPCQTCLLNLSVRLCTGCFEMFFGYRRG